MKVYLKRTIAGFAPADEEAVKYHSKGKLGGIYRIDLKKIKGERNWKLLQKYWKLLEVTTDNSDAYRTKESLHEAIKMELGITEKRRNIQTGEWYEVVGSIAMDRMDDDTFNKFYSDSINLILKHILKGTTEEELNGRVMEILSFA